MSNNRLTYYILFNLFKLPLLLWAVGLAVGLIAFGIQLKNQTCRTILTKRKELSLEAISHFSLFLSTNTLLPTQIKTHILEKYKVQAIQDENPFHLKVRSISEIKTLESIGVQLQKVVKTNEVFDVAIDPKILIPMYE